MHPIRDSSDTVIVNSIVDAFDVMDSSWPNAKIKIKKITEGKNHVYDVMIYLLFHSHVAMLVVNASHF